MGFYRRGFVEFATEEDAMAAVELGHVMTWEEKKLYIFRVSDTPGRSKDGEIHVFINPALWDYP